MWKVRPLLILATLLMLCMATGPARGDPLSKALASLRLHPPIGPPTSIATAAGSGFGRQEIVDLSFDAYPLASAHTGVGGRFSTEVRIPARALPGLHTVTATGEQSGRSAEALFTVRTDWTQFHFDPAHTGENPYENLLDPSTVAGLQLGWRLPTRGTSASSPIVADGVAYVGAGGYGGVSWVFAANAASGSLLWSAHILAGGLFDSSLSNGRLYVAGLDHELHAFNAQTGRLLWTTPGPVGSTAVSGGVVYVGDDVTTFYAIDAVTGATLWTVDTDFGGIEGAPAVADGVIYFGTDAPAGATVYAVDSSGHVLWTQEVGQVYGAPAVASGVVYVGSIDSHLYALDASTGAVLWAATTGAGIESSPVVADGTVFIGSNDGYIYALDAATGKRAWSTDSGKAFVLAAVSVAKGVVYGGSDQMLAIDARSGSVLWSFATGSLNEAPAIVDGTVYIASFDDHFYAFRLP